MFSDADSRNRSGSLFHRSGPNYQQCNKEFTQCLSGLQKTKGEVVRVGDVNIDLLKVEHIPTTKKYLYSIMTQGFPQNNFFLQDFLI